MKKQVIISMLMCLFVVAVQAQEIDYETYELTNGLDVILHQDNSAPIVTIGVMYAVGGKDGEVGRSGFAHFFEHLLFEGTKNIERGEWFNIVDANGGRNNAYTTLDRTFYYETFPSNALKLGLWMESERMLHPVINQIGVDTQNEVVKEEKRTNYDNRPYGNFSVTVNQNLFDKHPYKNPNIGYMEDLDAATLEEFKAFFDKYYGPNNATLVVAGDINIGETIKMIKDYFGTVPRGQDVGKNVIKEDPIQNKIEVTEYDSNIQIPLKVLAYRTPSIKDRDAYVLDMISQVLSGGKTSRLYKRMVDDDKIALQILAFARSMEDYGTYIIGALPLGDNSLESLTAVMDEEIEKIKSELISEKEYEKLQNTFENRFVSSNSSVEGRARSLATYHSLHGDVSLINNEIDIYKSITREEIMEVANKYLQEDKRLELDYLPENEN